MENAAKITADQVPAVAWAAWAGVLVVYIVWGGFSYGRPACDLFLAGITQAVRREAEGIETFVR